MPQDGNTGMRANDLWNQVNIKYTKFTELYKPGMVLLTRDGFDIVGMKSSGVGSTIRNVITVMD